MKKLMLRWLVLVALLACLGFASATDFRANAQDPPCPESCHKTCRAELQACIVPCPDYGPCVEKCVSEFDACIAYCDWVCGPE